MNCIGQEEESTLKSLTIRNHAEIFGNPSVILLKPGKINSVTEKPKHLKQHASQLTSPKIYQI